jgi:hypothetical protein
LIHQTVLAGPSAGVVAIASAGYILGCIAVAYALGAVGIPILFGRWALFLTLVSASDLGRVGTDTGAVGVFAIFHKWWTGRNYIATSTFVGVGEPIVANAVTIGWRVDELLPPRACSRHALALARLGVDPSIGS